MPDFTIIASTIIASDWCQLSIQIFKTSDRCYTICLKNFNAEKKMSDKNVDDLENMRGTNEDDAVNYWQSLIRVGRELFFCSSQGAFTQSDISHFLPVINVVGNTTLPRQKDHTVLNGAMSVGSFCRTRAVLPTTFMTGNK